MPSTLTGPATPDDAALDAVLDRSRAHWDALVAALDEAGLDHAWKYYGKSHGWQRKAVQGGKAVLYLVPGQGAFTAALALRDDALPALASAGVPASLEDEIRRARPAPEGRPARVLVRGRADVATVRALLAVKLASPGGSSKRTPATGGSTAGATSRKPRAR